MESLVRQTMSDIEIIVIDDRTPDNSMQVVGRFARDDRRFRLITHEHNRGVMPARHTGYMAATADYVVFCDSDDYLPLDAVEKLYQEAVRTDADIVSGNMTLVYPDQRPDKRWNALLRYGSDKVSVYKSLFLSEYTHNLCGKIFRRGLLQDHDYVNIDHFTNGEDGYLFYQLVENAGKVVHLDEVVYCYLQNAQSSSKKRLGERAMEGICRLNQLRAQIGERYPQVRRIAQSKVSSVLNSLYAKGYDKDAHLGEYVRTYGLTSYVSIWGIFRYNPLPKAIRLFLKRLLRK